MLALEIDQPSYNLTEQKDISTKETFLCAAPSQWGQGKIMQTNIQNKRTE